MGSNKIAITIDSRVLEEVDALVERHMFPSRSRAIQDAVKEKLERLNRSLLAQECAKLNPKDEIALAEEGIREDLPEWPEY
jgi:metal-responsive CopG/Arc/MetJ family transcriptional regulator